MLVLFAQLSHAELSRDGRGGGHGRGDGRGGRRGYRRRRVVDGAAATPLFPVADEGGRGSRTVPNLDANKKRKEEKGKQTRKEKKFRFCEVAAKATDAYLASSFVFLVVASSRLLLQQNTHLRPIPRALAVILATHYKLSIAVHVRHFTFIPTPRAGFDCDFGIVQLATPFKKVSQARSTPFKKGAAVWLVRLAVPGA